MTTISVKVPDNEAGEIKKLLDKTDGVLTLRLLTVAMSTLATDDTISSFQQGIKEVKMIERGEIKGFSFDEIWND